jgi:hypothetical protein
LTGLLDRQPGAEIRGNASDNGESRAFLLKKKSGQTGAIYQVKP